MTTAVTTTVVDASDYDLPPERAVAITDAFAHLVSERDSVLAEYHAIITAPMTPDLCDDAAELLKRLVKIRTSTARIHKTQKHLFLKAGQFVDAIKNAATEPVIQMESGLRDIKNYYIDIENARIGRIQAKRVDDLLKLEVENIPSELGLMADDAWEAMLGGYTQAAEQKAEATRLAEEQRLEAEQATARENEQLKKDNAEKAAEVEALRATNAAAAAEKKIADDAADAEREETARVARETAADEARVAEQQRIAQAQADSEQNKHAKKCEARDSLIANGIEEKLARTIVILIASGKIEHVNIAY